jgi:hypothetical protein
MTTVKTQATVRFGSSGPVEVWPSVHLNGSTFIDCHTYEDSAPVLVIDDGPVRVSVTVPDSSQVTAEDVERGRALAEAVVRSVAELEHRAASQDSAADEAA